MLAEGPEPSVLELQKLVESLCKHLRDATPGIGDPAASNELAHYLKMLEGANKDLVTEYAKATSEYEEALRQMKDVSIPEVPAAPETPPAPPEEDVLPIGLALRDQLLKRFGVPSKAVAAPAVVSKDVWEGLTASEEEQSKSEKDAARKTMPAGTPAFDADVAVDDDEVAEKPSEKARKPARPQPPTTPPPKKPSRPDSKKEIWDTGISEIGE